MRAYLVTLLIVSTFPVILLKPHVGVLVYSWFSYMNPHRLAYGFVDRIPFAMIIGSLTVGAWLISREPKKIPLTPLSLLMLLFVVWISVTTLFAIVPDYAAFKWDRVMKIMLITFLTMIIIDSRERLLALAWVIVVSIGFYGVKGGAFVILTGGNSRVWGPRNSFIEDNNALALALVMTLPLMRFLQIQTKNRILRIGVAGAMTLCVLSVLGSYSRGAALAAAAMLGMLWLRSRRRLALGITLVVAVGAGLALMPQSYYDRLSTLGEVSADGSAMSRLDTWMFTYDFALSRPIIGGGFGVFNSEAIREEFAPGTGLFNAHSIWFEILGEHGFVGLAMFVLIGTVAFFTCGRVRRNARGKPDQTFVFDLASSVQVSLVGFAVGGSFLNQAFYDLFWQILAIAVSLSIVAKKELAVKPETKHTTMSSPPDQAIAKPV